MSRGDLSQLRLQFIPIILNIANQIYLSREENKHICKSGDSTVIMDHAVEIRNVIRKCCQRYTSNSSQRISFQQVSWVWGWLQWSIRVSWWRHPIETFSALLTLCSGNSQSQCRGALMFSFIYAWIKGWINNREDGDLRRHRAYCDVIVMLTVSITLFWYSS